MHGMFRKILRDFDIITKIIPNGTGDRGMHLRGNKKFY